MQDDFAHTVAQAFVQFDTGCKGYLTRHELRVAHVAVIGHAPSKIEIEAMLPKRMDGVMEFDRHIFLPPLTHARISRAHLTGIEPGIDLAHFSEFMEQRLALQEPDEVTRRTFRAFDAHSKGYISIADFERVMSSIAPNLSRETVSLVFSEVDMDRDGAQCLDSSSLVPTHSPHWQVLQHLIRSAPALVAVVVGRAGRVSYKDFHAMMMAVRPGGFKPPAMRFASGIASPAVRQPTTGLSSTASLAAAR